MLRVRLLTAAFITLTASSADAMPWSEVGSPQLRQDVELLTSVGLIQGPINAWPFPWQQVCQAVSADPQSPQSPHIAEAARRLGAECDRQSQDTQAEVQIAITNQQSTIRDFGYQARENVDASLRYGRRLGKLHLSLGLGYRPDQSGDDLHLESTYAALEVGDWALYAGFVEHWWGPGHDNALLFSNNARPFPKLGVKQLSPSVIDLPLLRLLGPVQLEAFVGVLSEKRSDYNNPVVAGIRAAFSPAPGLEIGLNRALQLCGHNRTCNARTILDALIAFGNRDNTGTLNEPGNQIAGFDISYTHKVGNVTAQIYAEAEGEDENHLLIEQFGRLAGLNLIGPLGTTGGSWELRAEYVNTLASKLFGNSRRYAGSFYNNHIYTDGFTYKGRAIGSSLDTDGKMISLAGAITDRQDRRFYASLRSIVLNRTGLDNHRLTPDADRFNLFTIGVDLPVPSGNLRLEGRLEGQRAEQSRFPSSKTQFELSWRHRL